MLLPITIAVAAQGATPVSRDIRSFCREEPKCVSAQLEAARHFLGVTVMYDVPAATSEACLRRGKAGSSVDWTVSLQCLRERTKGRETVVGRGFKR